MKKQRIRISIALLLSSTLVFFGIAYYLVSNTYKLEKNIFYFRSTNLVSEIFFSTSIDFDEFDNHFEDYQKLLLIKESGLDKNDEFNQLKVDVQKAFLNFQNIGQRIDAALLNKGIQTEIKTAYSISRIENRADLKNDDALLESSLKKNELIIFGDESDLENYTFYIFHHTEPDTYYQSKLYIRFPKMWNYLLMQMKELLLGILLVMIIILSVFIYTMQTIRRQKKLADIKNDFINNMTHELNTPISTITVASQNLMKDDVNQRPDLVSELAATIMRQNKRLHKIVSEVMNTSLIESAQISSQLKEDSLHELLDKIIADFRLGNPDEKIEITTAFKAQNDRIALDSFQFSSAICNLLDNAKKYSKHPLKLHISTKNDANGIVLAITDNGIGISAKDQKMVFEKFYRVPHGNIHEVKGLGLGLYLVKQIIKSHKGNIRLKSNLGKGSTFIISLPI